MPNDKGSEEHKQQRVGFWSDKNKIWEHPALHFRGGIINLAIAISSLIIILVTGLLFKSMINKGYQKTELLKLEHQQAIELLKMKQSVANAFAKSITMTISYYIIQTEYKLKRSNADLLMSKKEKASEEYKEQKGEYDKANKQYEQYYEKYYSLDPSYEVACEMVKLYFLDNLKIIEDTKKLAEKIKNFVEHKGGWIELNDLKINKNGLSKEWSEKDGYRRDKEEIEGIYEKLINEIIDELRIKVKYYGNQNKK